MVDYSFSDYFSQDRADRQMTIESDDGLIKITNTELHQQQFELTESLCSESELTFGCCEASSIKFTVSNTFIPMKGKWLTVKLNPANEATEPLQIGRYKVDSDTRSADRTKRDIVAYDAMYDILNADVAEWYNTILPTDDSKVTLREFRKSFIAYFGLEEADADLVNDDMTVEKTVSIVASSETDDTSTGGEAMSGKDVITAICEINGCFGHIGRDGKFYYIQLSQEECAELYPADDLYPDSIPDYLTDQGADALYPQKSSGPKVGTNGSYISCTYEDYLVKTIDKLQVRQEEGDIGVTIGDSGDNGYIIEGNFLVYGKGSTELREIASRTFDSITGVVYRPFTVECVGNPCFEVGDYVLIPTKYEFIESFILQRTCTGIQSLKDTYTAEGVEEYAEKVNSLESSILQIKGKANILTRTIEETTLKMVDLTNGLESKITATAEQISAEVTRATEAEETLSASLTITAEKIESKVSKGDVSSTISQEADSITITGDRFSWTSTYSTLSADGTLTTDNGSHWVKITNGTMQAGMHGASTTAYIAGNTKYTGTGVYGLRAAGQGCVAFLTPNLMVGGYVSADSDVTCDLGQSGSTTFVSSISDNGDGTISWVTKTITFTKGLMTTIL